MDIQFLFQRLHANLPEELLEDDPLTVDNWKRVCRRIQTIEELLNQLQAPPIGFIYFQLPHQNTPEELWPLCKWKILPAETYQGAFFRTEGGNTAIFEDGIQDFAMVELSGNFPGGCGGFTDGVFSSEPQHNPVWNIGNASVGAGTINAAEQKYFNISNSIGQKHIDTEIRPQNYTMRIWERIA